jgi:hypothetical protein
MSYVCRFAPLEEALTMDLGPTVQRLMKETMKGWWVSMKIMVKERPYFRELNSRDAVGLIIDHLQDYTAKYQAVSPSSMNYLLLFHFNEVC